MARMSTDSSHSESHPKLGAGKVVCSPTVFGAAIHFKVKKFPSTGLQCESSRRSVRWEIKGVGDRVETWGRREVLVSTVGLICSTS